MSKKIVVITGSPRKNGNSFAMTDAFIRATEAKGHTVTRFDAATKNVGGCHACESCFKTGKACSFDDDFNAIAPAILEGDGNFLGGNGKASTLLMAAEGSGFEDKVLYYDHLMEHLRWKNLGHVLAGGNMAVGDIEGKPELKEAYELGKSIK